MRNFALALMLAGTAAQAGPDQWPAPDGFVHLAQQYGIEHTNDLPWKLRGPRKRMLDGETISFDDMRRLADNGDGLAAFRFGQRLVELGDPDVLPAAALYFATAALTGRDYAVRPLIEILEQSDVEIGERRLNHIENALIYQARQGEERAIEALALFYRSGVRFGEDPERARSLQTELALSGDPEAALRLATREMSLPGGGDQKQLRRLLGVAIEEGDLGTRTTARSLLSRIDANTQTKKDAE